MKKIVCELCGEKQFDKVDGRFVCKGCGTSYSAEEARGMMREVEGEEPVATGAPTVSMPQVNSNQQQLDNILMLASSAYEASNMAEAENYCNQAIVLDAMCYKAWLLKGRAVGWQSTVDNPRIEEASHSFCKAIDFAPEEEKESVKDQAVEELKNLGLALIIVRGENFGEYPDEEELAGFTRDRNILIEALTVLLSHGNAVDMPKDYLDSIATIMNNAAMDGYNTVSERYHSKPYPDDNDWERCMKEAVNCIILLRRAINASDDDDDADLQRYKNMILLLEGPLDWCSYERTWSSYSRSYIYTENLVLAESAKTERKNQIAEIKRKIKEIEDKEKAKEAEEARKAEVAKKARIEAYWEAHVDEKVALDSELKELNEKKDRLNKEMAELDAEIRSAEPTGKVPSEDEKVRIQVQISDLNSHRAKLGIFAGKEKKQIGEEIASLEGRLSALNSKIEEEKKARKAEADAKVAPIKAKRDELKSQYDAAVKRIAAINKELTKDPEE